MEGIVICLCHKCHLGLSRIFNICLITAHFPFLFVDSRRSEKKKLKVSRNKQSLDRENHFQMYLYAQYIPIYCIRSYMYAHNFAQMHTCIYVLLFVFSSSMNVLCIIFYLMSHFMSRCIFSSLLSLMIILSQCQLQNKPNPQTKILFIFLSKFFKRTIVSVKAYSMWYSQMVTYLDTAHARHCLTLIIIQDKIDFLNTFCMFIL